MDNTLIFISILLQIVSGIFSFIYSRKRFGIIWFFFGIAMLSMALNGVLSLFGLTPGPQISVVISFVISGLLFISILLVPKFFKEMDTNLNLIKRIWEIDRIIISSLTPANIISSIKKTIIELLNCNALAIYIINKDGAGFNNYANYNLDDEFHKGMIENGEFFWKVIRERKSSVITNKTNDIKNFPQLLSKYNFASCFGIPLILRGTPIGALFLFFNSKKRYTKEEIKFSEAIANQLVVAFEKINSLDRIKEMNLNTVLALVRAIEIRDPYTKGHSLQVSELAFELGKYIDLSNRQLELIKFAGLLHDVGKIAISESILNKPAPLNDYEWAIMKKHPEKSVEIIRPISDLREIETWILYHHERWDGTGYPEGKKDKEIPIGARILAVCDTFSAMTSDRPYRKALSLEETIEEIKNYKGKQFEPEIVDIFLKLPEEFLRRVIKKILTM